MEIKGFYLVAPSIASTGEEIVLKGKVLTEPYTVGWKCYAGKPPGFEGIYNLSPRGIAYMDNVIKDWQGTVSIDGGAGYEGSAEHSISKPSSHYKGDNRVFFKIPGIRFSAPGVKFIKVRDKKTGIESVSNAILVTEKPMPLKLYWADLHSQTFFSDGLRCPEELYTFAKEEAFLDMFAVSDHSEGISDRQWEYFQAVTNDFNKDGEFVTLIGQEWTNPELGHRNIYYPGNGGPILRADSPSELEKLYETAKKHKALVIPHHSANVTMGVDWSKGHNAEVEKLVETYSIWGNSELSAAKGNTRPIRVGGGEKEGQHVIDALARGYRFGFVGGGDIHDGRPGDELHSLQKKPVQYIHLYRQGLTGIWASGLTREKVFGALRDRTVYAASNVRVILNFSVSGKPMGSIIKCREQKVLHVKIFAASEVPVALIEIIKNGEVLKKTEVNKQVTDVSFEDRDVQPGYCYARVTRQDGEMAWSSPVWIST